jgi:hypothetical protein
VIAAPGARETMPLSLDQTRRYARQIALPELGTEGQERIAAATAVVVGEDLAARTAAEYLGAAGVGSVRALAPPAEAEAWLRALQGGSVVVRSGFDDDALLRAAVRLGVPAVIVRGRDLFVELVAFRRHGPCPHAVLQIPPRASGLAPEEGAGAVLAGTLAAAEALAIIVAPAAPPRARHLRLPLDGGPPLAQEIPWTPECFLCGGSGREASLS